MRLTLSRGILLLVVTLVTLVSVIWWTFARYSARRVIQLPDGRKITLLAVTYGTEHRYVHAPPLVKVMAPFRSSRWAALHGMRTAAYKTATPSVTFWLLWEDTRGTNQPFTSAAVFDGQGNESEPSWISTTAYPASGGTIVGWSFANYPRRAKWIGLKIFQWGQMPPPRSIAEFRVRNPGPRHYSEWTAPPLPVTKHDGDFEFTLLSFGTGKAAVERSRPSLWPKPYKANWNTATFRVAKGGRPSQAWQVAGMKVSDTMGNVCASKHTSFIAVGDELIFGFDDVVWPAETACKLRVEFSRVADFAPEALWTARSVAMPAAGMPTRVNPQTVVQGVELTSLELARAGPTGIPFAGEFQRTATAKLETKPALDGMRVTLVGVTDDRGRPVPHKPGYSETNTLHSFDLQFSPDARTVELTFAVHKSRFVEFLAKPSAASTNDPKPSGVSGPRKNF